MERNCCTPALRTLYEFCFVSGHESGLPSLKRPIQQRGSLPTLLVLAAGCLSKLRARINKELWRCCMYTHYCKSLLHVDWSRPQPPETTENEPPRCTCGNGECFSPCQRDTELTYGHCCIPSFSYPSQAGGQTSISSAHPEQE